MHFVLCDVCSVNNFVLYQLYVGISGHVENVIADYVPKVIINVNIEVFFTFIYWSMRCVGGRYKFVQFEEVFFLNCGCARCVLVIFIFALIDSFN